MKTAITQTPTRSRAVEASLKISDPLPRFDSVFPALETYEASPLLSYDHELVAGTTLLRALTTQSGKLFYHAMPASLSTTRDGEFVDSHWTQFSDVTVHTASRVALCEINGSPARLYFQKSDLGCYYADWSGSAFGTPVLFYTAAGPASFAAGDHPNNVFILEVLSQVGKPLAAVKIQYRTISSSTARIMPGYAYTTGTRAPACGAAFSTAFVAGSTAYLYFTVDNGFRTLYVRGQNSDWSEIQPVIPLDIIDDTSQFRLTSVSNLGVPAICGVLKRLNGTDMHVYLLGPEQFTMGREFFIRAENTPGTGKFVTLPDGGLWYIGPGIRWRSEQNGHFTTTPAYTPAVPASARVDMASNRPYTLQVELPSSFEHRFLRPGSTITPSFKIGSQWADMGKFSIDAITRPRTEAGNQLVVLARSEAMKRLAQWRSDASYDYWSQTKLSTNPKDLTKVLRVSGDWEERDGKISQEGLNTDGLLYMNAKACRGAEMRARFERVTGDFQTRFGAAVNFYRETKYEAAARLGIKPEEVQENQYGTNGIFAVYGPTEYSGNAGVGLYIVEDSIWTKLASASLSIAGNTPTWLMVRFIEGNIKVFSRPDSSAAWTVVLTHTFLNYDHFPWKRDQIGRGALFMRPITPYSTCYAFASDQDIIPLENNSAFNTSDVVQVDSEHIQYSSKGPNFPHHGLTYAHGDLLASGTAPGGTLVNFANQRESARLIQTFSLAATSYIRALKVWVKKINYPVDALHGGFWRGPATAEKPLGEPVVENSIPSENISPDGGWITYRFDGQEIRSGDWFILARGDNPTHPISETYYAEAKGAGSGAFLWDEQNDAWINQSGCAAYEVYGGDAAPSQWYSIYANCPEALSTTKDTYKNMALVVTDGAGKGSCFKVVGYTQRANKPYIFYVDRNPELLDETSVMSLVPTLLISTTNGKLDRGIDNTLPAAHGEGRQVDTLRAAPYIKCDRAEYYSSEVDLSLEDMARVIARKAGVKNVNPDGPYLYNSTNDGFPGSWEARNAIVDITSSSNLAAGEEIAVGARCSSPGGTDGVFVAIKPGLLAYRSGSTDVETITTDPMISAQGYWRVSIFDDAMSVWRNGRFVHTFTLTEQDAAKLGKYARVTKTAAGTVTVKVSEPNLRVDNFILDAGRGGDQLLAELIGEKRFYYQDNGDGTLRLFQKRVVVNSEAAPYDLAASEDETESDSQLATRVRLEGTDVCEKLDASLMIQYGNLFYQSNMREINSIADAEYFAAHLLEDFSTRAVSKRFTGGADPRIEPNDEVYVSVAGNSKKVIVDGIGFSLTANEQGAVFDMDIDGRVVPGG